MFEFTREDIASLTFIARQREAMGMTVAELARRVGVAPGTIHKIEDGTSNPQWVTVLAIAAELGMSPRMEWVGLPMMERLNNE